MGLRQFVFLFNRLGACEMGREKKLYIVIVGLLFLISNVPIDEVSAEVRSTKIIYYNGKNIVDPDNPLEPDYVITVPADLSFTEEERRIDASVSMNNLKGQRYSGVKKARVTVESKNNYALEHTDNFKRISYTLLKYDTSGKGILLHNTTPTGGDKSEIGEFSKDNTMVKSEAILGVTTIAQKNIGIYSDVLTYVVENL